MESVIQSTKDCFFLADSIERSSIKVCIIQKQWQLLQTKLNKVKEAQYYEQNQETEIRQTGKKNGKMQNMSRTGKPR